MSNFVFAMRKEQDTTIVVIEADDIKEAIEKSKVILDKDQEDYVDMRDFKFAEITLASEK